MPPNSATLSHFASRAGGPGFVSNCGQFFFLQFSVCVTQRSSNPMQMKIDHDILRSQYHVFDKYSLEQI